MDKYMDMDTVMETDMDTYTDMDTDKVMELEYFAQYYPYCATVAVAPYGLIVTHHSKSSKDTLNL
jgi:hypothetical protein